MSMPEQRVVPALRITHYGRSKAFYVEGLGFRVDWERRFEPHFPVFMSISRDTCKFVLGNTAATAKSAVWCRRKGDGGDGGSFF
jgi:Glyoxalase superfamily protein